MKLLIFVTGRGMGGDAVTAYNITKILESNNIESKIVLDPSAPGYYFKKRNVEWLTSPIPTAGGHATTKLKLIKGALKTLTASIQAFRLIKKEQADGVIGCLGGGCVIGCLAAKIAKVPSIGVVGTPTDTKISIKLNPTLILPESTHFKMDHIESKYDTKKQYLPIKSDIISGNKENILSKLPEQFNPNNSSVLFSSGSTLFDDMAKAARKFAEENENVNIFVIGVPLKEELEEVINHPNIINLGYINYIEDLYDLIDLAVITDDGLTLHETLACEIPIVTVIGVKYGRYHNLAALFEGAVLESHVDNISEVVNNALVNKEEMKKAAHKYSEGICEAPNELGKFVVEHMN